MTHKKKLLINLIAVAVLAVVMVGWVFLRLVGGGIGGGPFTVTVDLAASGGVFSNQEVTYRGVLVGKVGDMSLNDDGVNVDLLIDPEWENKIPADVEVTVRNKSAVGEQYVNLTPLSDGGDMLADGDVIDRERTHLPVDFQSLLKSLDLVLADISPDRTRNLVENLSDALRGRSEDIATIIESIGRLSETFADVGPEQQRLLDNATTAGDAFLRTKDNFSAAIVAADKVLAGIGDEPEELKRFFDANDRLAREGIALLARHADNLADGIKGLADLSTFQLENKEEMIIKTLEYVPQFLQAVEDASIPWKSPDGREFYRIRIGLIYDNVPASWPCKYKLPEDYERFPHQREERVPNINGKCEPSEQVALQRQAVRSLVEALEGWAAANPEELRAALAAQQNPTDLMFGDNAAIVATDVAFGWPLDGPITSYYGQRWGRMHSGIDIDGVSGAPVVASAPGTVVTAGYDDGGYGNVVVIDHGGGLSSLYAHLSEVDLAVGDVVAAGDLVGAVGCTGNCFGDHLHFEIRINGAPVDPLPYLPGGSLFAALPASSPDHDFGGD